MAGQVRDEQRRPIAHLRFIEAAAQRVTDTLRHNFDVQLVLEERADDGSLKVITPPKEFFIYYVHFLPAPAYTEPGDPMYEPARPGLIRQLTEELGLVHTTVEVLHRAGRRSESFDDHVFRVPYARGREEVVYEEESGCRWPQSYRDTYKRTRKDEFDCVNRYSFKRVPQSVMDTAPLLTVTFSRRLYSDFRQKFGAKRLAPYNMSASQQDELRAEVEQPLCWQRVREIRLYRHIDNALNRDSIHVTDHWDHYYTVQLVLEGLHGSRQVKTVPSTISALRIDERPGINEPGHRSLIRKLTEEMGLEHTTVPVVLRVAAEEGTYDNHVFRVK
jgi:hypothetical protein